MFPLVNVTEKNNIAILKKLTPTAFLRMFLTNKQFHSFVKANFVYLPDLRHFPGLPLAKVHADILPSILQKISRTPASKDALTGRKEIVRLQMASKWLNCIMKVKKNKVQQYVDPHTIVIRYKEYPEKRKMNYQLTFDGRISKCSFSQLTNALKDLSNVRLSQIEFQGDMLYAGFSVIGSFLTSNNVTFEEIIFGYVEGEDNTALFGMASGLKALKLCMRRPDENDPMLMEYSGPVGCLPFEKIDQIDTVSINGNPWDNYINCDQSQVRYQCIYTDPAITGIDYSVYDNLTMIYERMFNAPCKQRRIEVHCLEEHAHNLYVQPLKGYLNGSDFIRYLDIFPYEAEAVAFHSTRTIHGSEGLVYLGQKQRPRLYGKLQPSWDSNTEENDVDFYQKRSTLYKKGEETQCQETPAIITRHVSVLRKKSNSKGYYLIQYADTTHRKELYFGIVVIDSWKDYLYWKKSRQSGRFSDFPEKKVHNYLAQAFLFPQLNIPAQPLCDYP